MNSETNATPPALPRLLLTQRQAAESCAVCGKSLYLAVKHGDLRAVKIGRAVRYAPADLALWIAKLGVTR